MLFKYKYVKITTRNGSFSYAYQRTFLGKFKRYLSCAPSNVGRHNWSAYGDFIKRPESSCLNDDLKELKLWVKIALSPEYTEEDAETKLDKHLDMGEP
jgi:hypothetical protein